MNNEQVNAESYNRKKLYYRFVLGVQQMINYPFMNIIWIFFFIIVGYFVKVINVIFSNFEVFSTFENLFYLGKNSILITVPIICAIGIVLSVGYITAFKDEAKIYKILCISEDDKKEPPILCKKKTRKGITVREFYTSIPMKKWKSEEDNICEKFDIHFVEDLTYGGKNENIGYLKKITSAKGRKAKKRGMLYDDAF